MRPLTLSRAQWGTFRLNYLRFRETNVQPDSESSVQDLSGKLSRRHRLAPRRRSRVDPVQPGCALLTKQRSGKPMLGRRRHLNDSQRSLAASRLTTMRHGGDRRSESSGTCAGWSQAQAAEMMNVSERSLRNAAVVDRQGIPELRAGGRSRHHRHPLRRVVVG
jgi:hypothetical protein